MRQDKHTSDHGGSRGRPAASHATLLRALADDIDHAQGSGARGPAERLRDRPRNRRTRRLAATAAGTARNVQPASAVPAAAVGATWLSGIAMHAAHLPPLAGFAATGLGTAAAVLAYSKRLSAAGRVYAGTAAAYGTTAAGMIAASGPSGVHGGVLLAGAGLLSLPWWFTHRYKHHQQQPPEAEQHNPEFAAQVERTWDRYVEPNALRGTHLENFTETSNGAGVSADIRLPRGKMETKTVLQQIGLLTSAYDMPVTQVVAEPHPSGSGARAKLTVLERDMLTTHRPWTGSTIDLDTGLGLIGTYFDGTDAHARYFEPGSGGVNWLISGNTRNGKTTTTFSVIASLADPHHPVPIVPFWIDPEPGGQSMPLWRDKLTYSFTGEDEAIRALRAVNCVMWDRAVVMGEEGHDHFDLSQTGSTRPYIMVILEEAPVLLKESPYRDEAVALFEGMAKRVGKRGMCLVLITQLPTLDQIVSQTLRATLRSGNVLSHRTDEAVSQSMLGLGVDPHTLPRYLGNGEKAVGAFYLDGPDDRVVAGRSLWLPPDVKAPIAAAAREWPLDDRSADVFARVFALPVTATRNEVMAAAGLANVPGVAAVTQGGDGASAPVTDLQEASQERETAADRLLPYLADGQPHPRGRLQEDIRSWTTSMSTLDWGLKRLVDNGLAAKVNAGIYQITDKGRDELARKQEQEEAV